MGLNNGLKIANYVLIGLLVILLQGCIDSGSSSKNDEAITQIEKPKESPISYELLKIPPNDIQTPEGMVWVSGVQFTMGAKGGDPYALPREKPAHSVAVDGFFIDKTEVTNAEFQEFIAATGYKTVAERPIDWEEMKKQLPAGTPKPHDSLLQPGSLIFRKELEKVNNLANHSQWWEWKRGANWQRPEGPDSSIEGKENYPVVHVAYEDALAYAQWADRSLPTEAEWEAAAHGKLHGGIYSWGDDEDALNENANTWQGEFPVKNKPEDGYKFASPVSSFPSNSLGISDMLGNVWEITSDNYNTEYYAQIHEQGLQLNPKGSTVHFNPDNPYQNEKVIKGGSFLCNRSYCASYRISARMGMTLDSGSDHVGFRTIKRIN
ncbi:formylglycine-generating enzyme family protein [Christiangramia marina]|uniref:formylglycine-generating enzyme family protein n=1 Tax=Christiangramia marina TaxID=409436 RepID=UPI003AA7E31D